MTCVLRAGGTDFDVDACVASFPVTPHSIWRRGEPRYPQSNPDGEKHGTSGIRILVSKSDFSDLRRQITDAVEFLLLHQDAVQALASGSGVESVTLDFGVEMSWPSWPSFTFPPELLSLSGSAGVAVCLSVYPFNAESDDA
ncbi:hypothetical protein [Lysobacter brunescens]|uniref:DUF4279 domain-containing protein n=1 Tax=Lysobacter brunescens TaxID=262323 RepID=A0ABW2YJW2_9GAMM